MIHDELKEIDFISRKYDETNIPLYVSYPTTNWWRDKVDEKEFAEACKKVDRPFLYFHFPYCKKACYYCCCYKYVCADMAQIDTYIDYIAREFNQKLDAAGIKKLTQISQIHWGGGTPTFMTMAQIEKAFRAFAQRVDINTSADSSISIEAYPDDEVITYDKLKLLKQLGFNEISFGIQDFDDRIQTIINRDCNLKTVSKLFDQAKSLNLKVHVDLCYGLPFQGQNEFTRTAQEIVKLKPDRIAVYPYAHYPLLYPAQRLIPMSSIPNSFIKTLLAKIADEIFIGNGYGRVGSDHFINPANPLYQKTLEKKVERDFMGYSADGRRQFIGFGNSAISFLGNTLFHNLIPMEDYYRSIAAGGLAINKTLSHILSKDDTIRKRVMLKHILTDMMIDKNEIDKEFGISFDSYFQKELEELKAFEKDGLVEIDDSSVRITKCGVYFSRHIAHVFDSYYKD